MHHDNHSFQRERANYDPQQKINRSTDYKKAVLSQGNRELPQMFFSV